MSNKRVFLIRYVTQPNIGRQNSNEFICSPLPVNSAVCCCECCKGKLELFYRRNPTLSLVLVLHRS